MKNWIPKKSLIVTSSVVSLGFFLIYVFFSIFVFWQIGKIEGYYSDTESRSGREERTRVIRLFSEANKDYIDRLRGFFVKEGEEAKFIESVETAAKDAGIKFDIAGIKIPDNENEGFKENIEINIKTEGSWENQMRFVDSLDKLPFGTYVYELALDQDGDKWAGSVNFLVFREKSI